MCIDLSDGRPEWQKSRAADKAGSASLTDRQQNNSVCAAPIVAPFPKREGVSVRGRGVCALAGWPHLCTESSHMEMAVPRAWECPRQVPMREDVQSPLVLQVGFTDHMLPSSMGFTISRRVWCNLEHLESWQGCRQVRGRRFGTTCLCLEGVARVDLSKRLQMRK